MESSPEVDSLPGYTPREDGTIEAPDSKSPSAFPVEIDSQPIEQKSVKVIEGAEVFAAIKANEVDELDSLLQDGDANLLHGRLLRTPMHEAARLNRTSCASNLLLHGALADKEDGKGDSPLHLAAWEGHVEVASILISAGANIDRLSGRDGNTPLLCAIVGRRIDMARALLRHGARVSARSPKDMLPLHQAAITGQSAMCELLLEKGANVDCRDGEANTPLHYAATIGDIRTINVLLKEGADVNCRQETNLTPLHWACHKGHTEAVKILLRHDSMVDAKSGTSATPLHCAAARGHLGCVKTLMRHGADSSFVATWDGMKGTPEYIAHKRGYASVSSFIRGYRG
jgi:ankyrin repeat protein